MTTEYPFQMCYEMSFYYEDDYYGNPVITCIENPFGALKLSNYKSSEMILPDNIYFDVEFNEDNINIIRNVKYITFHSNVKTNSAFYEYLKTCLHYHVGFKTTECNKKILLSDSIKSLLICVWWFGTIIEGCNLQELCIGSSECVNYVYGVGWNVPKTVKKILFVGYLPEKFIIDTIESIIIVAVPRMWIDYSDLSNNLKELIIKIGPELFYDNNIQTINLHEKLRDKTKIINPDYDKIKINWYNTEVIDLPSKYKNILKCSETVNKSYVINWVD
jgi:hypothetical protein